MATYNPQDLGIKAPAGGFQQGGWYSGRQYWGGTLSDPGTIHPSSNQQGAGQKVSQDVNAQSAAQQGVSVQQFDDYLATNMRQPANVNYTSGTANQSNMMGGVNAEVEKARKALEENLNRQKAENDRKLADLKAKEQTALGEIDKLTTPFREDIEKTERERLFVDKNFTENQKLVDELDSLLTEGNNLIKEQSQVTGLASVRNPRIQKTMDDVSARVGVIQAVMNARNGQIQTAFQMIDRTVGAIAADRQDRLSYYETVLNLNNRDILNLTEENRTVAAEQLNILKTDLSRATETADYVKKLMMNPDTAMLMGQAGVSLNDDIATINQKLTTATMANEIRDISNQMSMSGYTSVYDPSSVPANQLVTITDKMGNKYYYRKSQSSGGGNGFNLDSWVNNNGWNVKGMEGMSANTGTSIDTTSLWDSVFSNELPSSSGKPQFAPSAGVGTMYTNSSGTWKFTADGWVAVGGSSQAATSASNRSKVSSSSTKINTSSKASPAPTPAPKMSKK